MSLRFYSILIDCADPVTLSRWWAEALGWKVTFEEEGAVDVASGQDENGKDLEPILTFLAVKGPKTVKNRLHIDLRPDNRDVEVERLIGLGASRVDIGQGDDVSWVVLADPAGNEFCVLQPDS